MDQFGAMTVFRRVVEAGSYSGAARALRISVASASKQVAWLEQRLGARLLHRTTRRLALTEAGREYYARCGRILDEVADAEARVAEREAAVRGNLRVTAPFSFGLLHMSAPVTAFARSYPDVRVELVLSDRLVDLVEEGFDVAVRMTARPADTSLVSVKLARARRVVCAAPGYLKRAGRPRKPADLAQHRCLINPATVSPTTWLLRGPEGPLAVEVHAALAVNSSISLRDAALAELGLVLMPEFVVAEELRDGRLEAVLTAYEPEPLHVYALHPHGRFVPRRVRLFVDALREQFSGAGWRAR
ncbi:LysR family transcriptional regulator [Myxococcus sp. RHSTA-1-4]|uniref:LysR family transcriptional regulator n=1 Tax=Myxococcus sp. RHSTA-1-4 TaxID=2874601 RepID=UPI001CBCD64B|nr:LysR family transcriptional regulator [Myxococcus sp. RHSTA-1-4]